ncbi:MAG: acyltransferase [Solirubrobacterales bacterium]
MVYGWRDRKTSVFRKYTRISSSSVIMSPERLAIGDSVWIWHYSIVDATEGVEIGEGCQISSWVGIFTHGSQSSIRLLGEKCVHIPCRVRGGYDRGRVVIGQYSFIGPGSIILPGVTIGKGCLIVAGMSVNKDIPDYAVVAGQPGRIIGSTIEYDARQFKERDFSDTYYDREALALIMKSIRG